MSGPARVCLVSASGQNVFFGEILDAFRVALLERGVVVEESVDCFPPPAADLVYVFVAHEYHPMVHERAHPSDAQMRRSIALCAEQPGTNWFEIVADYAARAGAAIDINAIGARELSRRGIPTEHAPLGYVPAWDVWGGRAAERPIDVAFLGRYTDRRADAIARCAPALSSRRASIRLTETFSPHVAGSPYFLTGERRARLLADSKVLLNVHQQELAYMEWHRVLSAIVNGCVVVSEHSRAFEPLEPGVHFVSAAYDELPDALEAVLGDPQRQAAIRSAAYDLVRERIPMAIAADALLRAVERVASAPVDGAGPGAPPAPLPKPPPERQLVWEVDGAPGESRLRSPAPAGGLAAARAAVESVEDLGGTSPCPRWVSILVARCPDARSLGETLRSVAASVAVSFVEVVVVDDWSLPGCASAVRDACRKFPRLTVRLVRGDLAGESPAVARNAALAHARGDLVFVLDAGNVVDPHGLSRLLAALDGRPDAAFAYGILQARDDSGPAGLRSWLDWSPERLQYGNYIESMALVRRPALEALDGYPTDPSLAGWEDFAIWLALSTPGAAPVHDLVGSCRVAR